MRRIQPGGRTADEQAHHSPPKRDKMPKSGLTPQVAPGRSGPPLRTTHHRPQKRSSDLEQLGAVGCSAHRSHRVLAQTHLDPDSWGTQRRYQACGGELRRTIVPGAGRAGCGRCGRRLGVAREEPRHTQRTASAAAGPLRDRMRSSRAQILISAQCMKKAEFSITSGSDVQIDLGFLHAC